MDNKVTVFETSGTFFGALAQGCARRQLVLAHLSSASGSGHALLQGKHGSKLLRRAKSESRCIDPQVQDSDS